MKKIKSRCPKCKAAPRDIFVNAIGSSFYAVVCKRCGASTEYEVLKDTAIDAWNKGQV